jgi:hypothetical protein
MTVNACPVIRTPSKMSAVWDVTSHMAKTSGVCVYLCREHRVTNYGQLSYPLRYRNSPLAPAGRKEPCLQAYRLNRLACRMGIPWEITRHLFIQIVLCSAPYNLTSADGRSKLRATSHYTSKAPCIRGHYNCVIIFRIILYYAFRNSC